MDNHIKQLITKEMEQFHCSILLEEVKEKIRKLKAYGLEDAEILTNVGGEELLPQLIVTEDYKIVLANGAEKEVKMEPLVKAVYLLFLIHHEGIILKCLPDYKDELTQLYLLFRPSGLTCKILKRIEDVTNPTQNSINEKCTRIRNAFAAILPINVARYYCITGKRGEGKRIELVHSKISLKCKLPGSQGL